MSWSVIAEAEVLQEWNSGEPALIAKQQALANNLPAILTRVVNSCRGSVRAGGGQIGPALTIPDQLRGEVIAIARWKLLLSLPEVSESLLSAGRKDAYKDAMKMMRDVAAGTIKVEVPDAPVAQAGPSNAVSVPRPGQRLDTCGFGKMGSS